MSEQAVLRRLKTVDQLRELCLSLMKAKRDSDEKAKREKQSDKKTNAEIDVHTHILPKKSRLETADSATADSFDWNITNRCLAQSMVKDDGKFFAKSRKSLERRNESKNATVSAYDVQVLSTVPVMFRYWAKRRLRGKSIFE
jgi:hypothetical protein